MCDSGTLFDKSFQRYVSFLYSKLKLPVFNKFYCWTCLLSWIIMWIQYELTVDSVGENLNNKCCRPWSTLRFLLNYTSYRIEIAAPRATTRDFSEDRCMVVDGGVNSWNVSPMCHWVKVSRYNPTDFKSSLPFFLIAFLFCLLMQFTLMLRENKFNFNNVKLLYKRIGTFTLRTMFQNLYLLNLKS